MSTILQCFISIQVQSCQISPVYRFYKTIDKVYIYTTLRKVSITLHTITMICTIPTGITIRYGIIDFHRTRNRCFYADPQANTATSTASSFCSIFEHGVVIKLSNFHTNTGTVCIIGIRFILRNNAIV